MQSKYILLFIAALVWLSFSKAQSARTDSAAVATILKSLLNVCKTVDFADPKTQELGIFYKAAPYIIYQGSDKNRAWKEFVNYSIAEDKKGTDEICTDINETVNRDSSYQIIKYHTEKESEGVWHVLMVTYKKKGVEKHAAFAFLKIGNRFGLGDID